MILEERRKGRRLAVAHLRAVRALRALYKPSGMAPEAYLVFWRWFDRAAQIARGQLEAWLLISGEPIVLKTATQIIAFRFGPTSDGLLIDRYPRSRQLTRPDEQGGPRCSA